MVAVLDWMVRIHVAAPLSRLRLVMIAVPDNTFMSAFNIIKAESLLEIGLHLCFRALRKLTSSIDH